MAVSCLFLGCQILCRFCPFAHFGALLSARPTSNPNKSEYNLRAISTQIEIISRVSTTRGVVTENSSDLDLGRRPELESDEFSVTTPLVVEILGRKVDTFPKKVYTY